MDAEPSDLREKLNSSLDSVPREDVDALVERITSMTKLKWGMAEVACKKCGTTTKTRVQIDSPDYRAQADAVSKLLDQAKGKPKESAGVSDEFTDARIAKVVHQELKEWTNTQLQPLLDTWAVQAVERSTG